MAGTDVFPRASGRTILTFLALLSIVFGTMALVIAQPVRAAPFVAVLALSQDCSVDHKQVDLSGNNYLIQGDVHSNAGMLVAGNENHATGDVRFNGDTPPLPTCNYLDSGTDNTGGFDNPPTSPASSAPMGDPLFAVPDPADCTFDFSGRGPIDLNGEDGGAGEEDVWDPADPTLKTLKTGLYCHDDLLQQSRQGVSGTVSFYSTGYIDLSNGSDTNLTAYRADGVLTHSTANSVNAVKLAGSGTDAENNSFYNGILYAPNGEGEVSGQFITTGCIVAETVKLDGSNNTVGACDLGQEPPAPLIEIVKDNDTDGPVNPGDEVNFTITVNVTDGPAEDSVITDFLPDGYDEPTDISDGGLYDSGTNSISWGPLTVADGDTFTYTAAVSTDVADGAELENNVFITSPGTNCPPLVLTGVIEDDPCHDDSIVIVEVPEPEPPVLQIVKENDAEGPVQPGDSVNFTITVNVTNGPAEDAIITDTLPDGYDDPTAISDGGVWNGTDRTITWGPLTVSDGDTFTYTAAVSLDVADDTELRNVVVITSPGTNCPPDQEIVILGDDPCDDDSTVIVDVPPLEPALVVDKVADAETITISGPANAPVANPSVVTWTLTYTLTNGPVDNAVITDDVPAGFVFLDASDGGTEAGGVVTWNLGTITTGGSVSFRTTVDPETISRTAPTVNVAVIDSDQTEPDEGQDSVTVTVIPPVAGGNPSPSGSVPDTAFGIGLGGETISVPLELLVVTFIGSLGALTAANVRAWNRRR